MIQFWYGILDYKSLHFIIIRLFYHFLYHSSELYIIQKLIIFMSHLLLIDVDTQFTLKSSLNKTELKNSVVAFHKHKKSMDDSSKNLHLISLSIEPKH